MQRAALVNLGELAAYDTAKQAALDSGERSAPYHRRPPVACCPRCHVALRMNVQRLVVRCVPSVSLRFSFFAGLFSGGDDPRLHVAAAGTSGFVATVCSTPADVVKTRLMSQRAGAPQLASQSAPRPPSLSPTSLARCAHSGHVAPRCVAAVSAVAVPPAAEPQRDACLPSAAPR